MEITFADLEIIKDSLGKELRDFKGSVSEKKITDETYLKIYKFFQEINLYSKTIGISKEDIKSLSLKINYELSDINNLKSEKENLTFKFD